MRAHHVDQPDNAAGPALAGRGAGWTTPATGRRIVWGSTVVALAVIATGFGVVATSARHGGGAAAVPTQSASPSPLPYPENIRIPVHLLAQREGIALAVQSPGAVTAPVVSEDQARRAALKWSGLTAATTIYGAVLVNARGMGGPYDGAHLFWAVSVTPDLSGSNYGIVFVDAQTGVAVSFDEGNDPSLSPLPTGARSSSGR